MDSSTHTYLLSQVQLDQLLLLEPKGLMQGGCMFPAGSLPSCKGSPGLGLKFITSSGREWGGVRHCPGSCSHSSKVSEGTAQRQL